MSMYFVRNDLFFMHADQYLDCCKKLQKFVKLKHAKNIAVDLLTLAIYYSYSVNIAVWLSPFYKVL